VLTVWLGWLAILGVAAVVPGLFGVGIALPVPSRWLETVGARTILALWSMLLVAPVIALTAVWGWYRWRH
jgi:hypothetical protein